MLKVATAPALIRRLEVDPDRIMSVANYIETGTVLAGRRKSDPLQAIIDLNGVLEGLEIALVPVDAEQARVALLARIQYGRGMGHGGTLNFGDIFAYSLAKLRRAALLFTGVDFLSTDIEPALKSEAD